MVRWLHRPLPGNNQLLHQLPHLLLGKSFRSSNHWVTFPSYNQIIGTLFSSDNQVIGSLFHHIIVRLGASSETAFSAVLAITPTQVLYNIIKLQCVKKKLKQWSHQHRQRHCHVHHHPLLPQVSSLFVFWKLFSARKLNVFKWQSFWSFSLRSDSLMI